VSVGVLVKHSLPKGGASVDKLLTRGPSGGSANLIERFNQWMKESITIKLLSIGFLILILLIPSAWIQNLMEERQERAESVINEIADKWSGSQTLSGPILVLPYIHREIIYLDKEKEKVEIKESTRKAFFLPETLDINGKVNPEIRHRGIFDAVVYNSNLNMQAQFAPPDFKKLEIEESMVYWHEAHHHGHYRFTRHQ
jgi:inner membrane protein